MGKLDQIARDDADIPRTLPPPLVGASLPGFVSQRGAPAPVARPLNGVYPIPVAPPRTDRASARLPGPSPMRVSGRIVQSRELARDIIEITIATDEPFHVPPGQYCRFSFNGLPYRQFSPTAALASAREDGYLRLHVKRVRGGRVTPHLGKTIKAGHHVDIAGPYGRPFVAPASPARLVLIGSGTGFAPVWAIAAALLREPPSRPIVIAGAAATLDTFYMAPALELARSHHPNVSIVASVDELTSPWHGFVPGPLTARLPRLSSDDVVYAAGGHALVGAVGKAAAVAGATFHADPLEPAPQANGSWIDNARRWLSVG